ncbi:MAG TPA: hypothetical protein VJP45_01705 [Candidatus Limnocylindria bacterium]|nr:hypothetical protein [Candidatus Limnocylindria bacterium]
MDLSDLQRSAKGSITARVCVVLDGFAFPERAWSDLVVVVLGWWIEELLRPQSIDERTMTLSFIDGPYSVRLRARDAGEWSVSLVRDAGPTAGKGEVGVIERAQFAASLLAAAREVVAACRARGWSEDREVRKLAALTEELAEKAHQEAI